MPPPAVGIFRNAPVSTPLSVLPTGDVPTQRLTALLLAAVIVSATPAQPKRPLALDDTFAVKRISAPAVLPDGRLVAHTVTMALVEENRTTSDVWISPVVVVGNYFFKLPWLVC